MAECQGPNGTGMSYERVASALPTLNIPQDDLQVRTSRSEYFSVRAERQGIHEGGMTLQWCTNLDFCFGIPQQNNSISPTIRQYLAVWTNCNSADCIGMSREFHLLTASLNILNYDLSHGARSTFMSTTERNQQLPVWIKGKTVYGSICFHDVQNIAGGNTPKGTTFICMPRAANFPLELTAATLPGFLLQEMSRKCRCFFQAVLI